MKQLIMVINNVNGTVYVCANMRAAIKLADELTVKTGYFWYPVKK